MWDVCEAGSLRVIAFYVRTDARLLFYCLQADSSEVLPSECLLCRQRPSKALVYDYSEYIISVVQSISQISRLRWTLTGMWNDCSAEPFFVMNVFMRDFKERA